MTGNETPTEICQRRGQCGEPVTAGCPDCGHVMLLHPAPGNDVPDCVVCRVSSLSGLALLAAMLPGEDLIPLASLRRLDLQDGDALILVAPADIDTPYAFAKFREYVGAYLAERLPNVNVVFFPAGTELAALRPPSLLDLPPTITDEDAQAFRAALDGVSEASVTVGKIRQFPFPATECRHDQPLELLPVVRFSYDFLCPGCGLIGHIGWQPGWAAMSFDDVTELARPLALQDIKTTQELICRGDTP